MFNREVANNQQETVARYTAWIEELKDENESLNNTVIQLEKYKQRCKELENENYNLKLDKQNLIGLRDALNSRIEELEDELNSYDIKEIEG